MFPYLRNTKHPILTLPITRASLERERKMTYPLAYSSRSKQRRWPLVLRFHKGAIHGAILLPILVHAAIAALVVFMDKEISYQVSLPSSIIPSISIVMGLMLVFRNQTAYSRFWDGRLHLNTVTTSVRCLTRQILVLSPPPPPPRRHSFPTKLGADGDVLRRAYTQSVPNISVTNEAAKNNAEEDAAAKVVETVKILIAMLYTIKNHLRADWGVALSPGTCISDDGQVTSDAELAELLPKGLKGYEHRGLALTLELAVFVESFIAMGSSRNWFHNSAVSQMLAQLDKLNQAYGNMEVIRLTPIPVAHLVHHEQTLALFCIFLSFAMAAEIGWWAVPLLAFVSFTLYGIEGIAQTYEDPFGIHKIDIRMDDIVEDARREVEVLLSVWENQNHGRDHDHRLNGCNMFVPLTHVNYSSDISSESQDGRDSIGRIDKTGSVCVRWAGRDTYIGRSRESRNSSSISPGVVGVETTLSAELPYGARRVTWGSSVGDDDMGVFEAPKFFDIVPTH